MHPFLPTLPKYDCHKWHISWTKVDNIVFKSLFLKLLGFKAISSIFFPLSFSQEEYAKYPAAPLLLWSDIRQLGNSPINNF